MNFHMQNQTVKAMNVQQSSSEMSLLSLKLRFLTFSAKLDLVPVKYKLVKEKGWSLQRVTIVEPQYKAFLYLIGTKHDQMFVPTLDIDEMWHGHILDTRKYMADCAEHFGEYIHHYPYLGLKDGEDEVRAQKLFAATCAVMLEGLAIDVNALRFSCCGGGGGGGCGGGGGASCGTASCSGGAVVSCTNGDGGAAVIMPVVCGGITYQQPATDIRPTRDEISRRPERERERQPEPPVEKKGILSRILGLSPRSENTKWQNSVTPDLFSKLEYRPDIEALNELCSSKNYH